MDSPQAIGLQRQIMEEKKIEHGKSDQKTKAMTAQSEAALTMFAQATAAEDHE